jgi:hypothetical protein
MPRRNVASALTAALAVGALVACSDQSPLAPHGTPEGLQSATTLAQPAKGTYTLSFRPTSSGLGVILVAFVTDAFGNPATSGTAAFDFCTLNGKPAPSSDCPGSGGWVRVVSAGIISCQPPCTNTGFAFAVDANLVPPAGTTIGFHFRYLGQGSGIANAVSLPEDHTF